MTIGRYFYVIYPSGKRTRALLNALKMVANEEQRTEAHITLRGPYTRKLPAKFVERATDIISQQCIDVISVGNFFDEGQNTVFLRCNNKSLKYFWKKKSYPHFNPHITIYDGDSRTLALQIHNILLSYFVEFSFYTEGLSWLEPNMSDELDLFHLKSMHYTEISELINYDISYSNIKSFSLDLRLKILEELCTLLFSTKEICVNDE